MESDEEVGAARLLLGDWQAQVARPPLPVPVPAADGADRRRTIGRRLSDRLGAAYAALAVELEAQRQLLQRRNRELGALLETTQQLTAELDQQVLLGKVLDAARALLDAVRADLWLSEPPSAQLVLVASTAERDADQTRRWPLHPRLVERVIASGQ